MNSPLSLSLVRDTCQSKDDVSELLAFSASLSDDATVDQDAEDVTDYLLDRVIPAAYTHQPGQPPLPYDLATAQNALTKLAVQMNYWGNRDMYWWQILTWVPETSRRVVFGVVVGVVVGVVFGLAHWLAGGLAGGLVGSLAGRAHSWIRGLVRRLVRRPETSFFF